MSADPTMAGLADRARERSRPLDWCLERRNSLAVWASMFIWSALLFARIRSDYLGFRIGKFDLGNMTQAVWSTAHGRPLEFTTGPGEQVVRLGIHVDPILVLLAPLWAVAPTPLSLAFAQVAALALGALPVFWLGRRHLGSERPALVLALAYLFYPWLAWSALDAIHPVTFAIPLLLYGFWFLDSNRLVPFAVCAVLAASCGELLGLTVAALGVWYALARGRRVAGGVIAVAGLAWTLVALEVVVRAFSGGSSVYYGLYSAVGGSPAGIVRTLFTHPGAIVSALTGTDDIAYVIWLGIPLAGTFLLAPALAAVAIPQLLANGLAAGGGTTDPRQHYLAAILPVLFAASVLGIARLRPERRLRTSGTVLVLCVLFTLFVAPFPGAPARAPLWYQTDVPQRHVAALRRALAFVPAGAPVSATNKVGAHLAARRYLYTVPIVRRAQWIVLDTQDPWVADPSVPFLLQRPEALRAFAAKIEGSSSWTRVFDEDGVLVFSRAAARS